MNKRRKCVAQDFRDDGRTIANMDIPGMPWHNLGRRKPCNTDNTGLAGGESGSGAENEQSGGAHHNPKAEKIVLTIRERAAVFLAALWVTVPIILFFGISYALILLFLRFIWLR